MCRLLVYMVLRDLLDTHDTEQAFATFPVGTKKCQTAAVTCSITPCPDSPRTYRVRVLLLYSPSWGSTLFHDTPGLQMAVRYLGLRCTPSREWASSPKMTGRDCEPLCGGRPSRNAVQEAPMRTDACELAAIRSVWKRARLQHPRLLFPPLYLSAAVVLSPSL